MSQSKVSGGSNALPVMSQEWSPQMASAIPLCTQAAKRTYETRRRAAEEARAIRRRGGKRVEPYECPCGKFHLTKHSTR